MNFVSDLYLSELYMVAPTQMIKLTFRFGISYSISFRTTGFELESTLARCCGQTTRNYKGRTSGSWIQR